MIGPSVSCCGLLPALGHFVELVLEGRTPLLWRTFFFGTNLTALQKKSGGIGPIAIGCTLRCLAAKVMGGELREEMRELLAPWQLGYRVRKEAEVAVHAARLYLHNLDSTKALLKLDFSNALNSIRRDKMFMVVLASPDTFVPSYLLSATSEAGAVAAAAESKKKTAVWAQLTHLLQLPLRPQVLVAH